MNGDRRDGIDWDQVKRRLAESEHALERSLGDDADRLDAVYRQRAEQLAVRRGRSLGRRRRPSRCSSSRWGRSATAFRSATWWPCSRSPTARRSPGRGPNSWG